MSTCKTSKVFIPSFFAEEEWRPPRSARLGSRHFAPRQGGSDLDHVMSVASLRPESCYYCSQPLPDIVAECFIVWGADLVCFDPQLTNNQAEAVPFAVSDSSYKLCRELGLTFDFPDLQVVASANSKIKNVATRSLICGSFGTCVYSISQLKVVGEQYLSEGPFLIKEEYGSSGSGVTIVHSSDTLQAVIGSLEAQLADNKEMSLLLEKFIPKRYDVSSHILASSNGEHSWTGLQQTLNLGFRYLGSRGIVISSPFTEKLQSLTFQLADKLSSRGYFGQICADNMISESGQLVPLIDINARMSMGYINLCLEKFLSTFGYRSTLLKFRVSRSKRKSSLLEDLLSTGLSSSTGIGPCVLPVTGSCAVNHSDVRDIVVALVYRSEMEERSLWGSLFLILNSRYNRHTFPESYAERC